MVQMRGNLVGGSDEESTSARSGWAALVGTCKWGTGRDPVVLEKHHVLRARCATLRRGSVCKAVEREREREREKEREKERERERESDARRHGARTGPGFVTSSSIARPIPMLADAPMMRTRVASASAPRASSARRKAAISRGIASRSDASLPCRNTSVSFTSCSSPASVHDCRLLNSVARAPGGQPPVGRVCRA